MDKIITENLEVPDGQKGELAANLKQSVFLSPEKERSWDDLLAYGNWEAACSLYLYPPGDLSQEQERVLRSHLSNVLFLVARHSGAARNDEASDENEGEFAYCYQTLYEHGLIQDSKSDHDKVYGDEQAVEHPREFRQEVIAWVQDTQQAIRMMRDLRRRNFAHQEMDKMFGEGGVLINLLSLGAAAGVTADSPINTPSPIVDAVYAQLATVSRAFDSAEKEAFNRSLRTDHQSVVLTMHEQLLAKYLPSGTSFREWIGSALHNMPRAFIHQVDTIRFVRNGDPRFSSLLPDAQHNVALGRWIGNQYQMEIYIDAVERQATLLGIPDDDMKEYMLQTVQAAMDHEYGHNALAIILTLTNIREWIRLTRNEHVSVSTYVGNLRNHAPQELIDEEDFCETLRLFLMYPDRLKEAAPLRFAYFQKLAQEYSNDSVAA